MTGAMLRSRERRNDDRDIGDPRAAGERRR
jgi:hypothetical protein